MRFETTAGQFDISDSGDLIYAQGGIAPTSEASLVWVDLKGQAEAAVPFKSDFEVPRVSPDGQKFLYYTATPAQRVWIFDIQRGIATPLTSEGRANEAVWTPDGARVVFNMATAGGYNLFWQPADGSSPVERLTSSTCQQWPGSWSDEGRILTIIEKCKDDTNISILRMGDRQVTPLLNSRFDESCAEFSPDGHWLAYMSDESGREEVYVRPFPGSGGRRQISSEGGSEPLWARSGRELFYRQGPRVWSVGIESGPGLSMGKPHLLFEQPAYASWGAVRDWDISLDGQRFLMVKMEEKKPQPVTELILVQNWLEELKRLCPAGKN
jgi:serine/threonine-protein kinase